jgi:hypothetical protein
MIFVPRPRARGIAFVFRASIALLLLSANSSFRADLGGEIPQLPA